MNLVLFIKKRNRVWVGESTTTWSRLCDQDNFVYFYNHRVEMNLQSHLVQFSALRQKYITEADENQYCLLRPPSERIHSLSHNLWIFFLWLFKMVEIHMVFWSLEVLPLGEMNKSLLKQISPPLKRRSLIISLEIT